MGTGGNSGKGGKRGYRLDRCSARVSEVHVRARACSRKTPSPLPHLRCPPCMAPPHPEPRLWMPPRLRPSRYPNLCWAAASATAQSRRTRMRSRGCGQTWRWR
eukprot:364795-Chlamydomonas_euryale.AAC.24